MLYLIATPIGNLEDISLRALRILKECDYILCEDTRHSQILLEHYQIKKPLKSLHRFNEKAKEAYFIADLKAGRNIALISDAGTPGLCDPGTLLVQACRREKIPCTALPGPCAAVTALSLSGLEIPPFQFIGFLPKKEAELVRALEGMLDYPGVSLCYETPHHIEKTLQQLLTLAPTRPLSIARELTKTFEELLHGTAESLLAHFASHPPRGEMVLLLSAETNKQEFSSQSLLEDIELLESRFHLSRSDAIKAVAQFRSLPKRSIYRLSIGSCANLP